MEPGVEPKAELRIIGLFNSFILLSIREETYNIRATKDVIKSAINAQTLQWHPRPWIELVLDD